MLYGFRVSGLQRLRALGFWVWDSRNSDNAAVVVGSPFERFRPWGFIRIKPVCVFRA